MINRARAVYVTEGAGADRIDNVNIEQKLMEALGLINEQAQALVQLEWQQNNPLEGIETTVGEM